MFDIVADRACTSACAAALVVLLPDTALPIAVFLVQFMVIDQLLSLMFLRWPLLSPNHFAGVDDRIYRWNWSPPAKALNTAAVVVLAIVAPTAVRRGAVGLGAPAAPRAPAAAVRGDRPGPAARRPLSGCGREVSGMGRTVPA